MKPIRQRSGNEMELLKHISNIFTYIYIIALLHVKYFDRTMLKIFSRNRLKRVNLINRKKKKNLPLVADFPRDNALGESRIFVDVVWNRGPSWWLFP